MVDINTINAIASNGGLISAELRKKIPAGTEVRGGEVIDEANAPGAADPADLHARQIGGSVFLYSGRLTTEQKKLLDAGEVDAADVEGYLGTFTIPGGGKPASGGVDGVHPEATVSDVVLPSAGNVPIGDDQLKAVLRDDAQSDGAKDMLQATDSASVEGKQPGKPAAGRRAASTSA